ncbi:MAG TPA: hypothetical protein VFE38_10290 [Edaphobacter sp.]|nr:hypothetical protein [Edaphobacter sp.]
MDADKFMRRIYFPILLLVWLLVIIPGTALAHVGSRDVYEQVKTGPYRLFITVHVPSVVPGPATVAVQSSGAKADAIDISSALMTSMANSAAAVTMSKTPDKPDNFTGNVWLSTAGSWEIRFTISGAEGKRTAVIPVAAVAESNMTVERSLAFTLGLLALLLLIGTSGIAIAWRRDSRLAKDPVLARGLRLRSLGAGATAVIAVALLAWAGTVWWSNEANGYRPLGLNPVLEGNRLQLKVIAYSAGDKGAPSRSNDDFLPDDGHLMHLYMIRWPQMDAVFHLHPVRAAAGDFRVSLPTMPAGEYRLFGDIVHQNGFPETLVANISVPADMPGGSPTADDAEGTAQPLSQGMLGDSFKLPDGYVMVWDRPAMVRANTAYAFRFRLLDPNGQPATDMQPYLGMAGHAAFVKTDGSVFAHTHPEGSAAMAAVMLADKNNGNGMGMPMNMATHSGEMTMHSEPMSNVVEFPYGFPSSGRYRIFIQMKHGTTVETGTFDVMVE